MLGAGRTLAVLLFITGVAAAALALARTPTVADGRVMAADRLEEVRKDGAVAMDCDEAIPIGRAGAVFTCIATLRDGATQLVEYTLRPEGGYEVKPQPPTHALRPRNPALRDPRTNRP
jgi:hypothetical protein